MTWVNLEESTFKEIFLAKLSSRKGIFYDFVTGPGRSGAVASVYASHYLGVAYKPHKCGNYAKDERILLVDTVEYTGKTLRKAAKWYMKQGLEVDVVYGIKEYQGHYFKMWYEI